MTIWLFFLAVAPANAQVKCFAQIALDRSNVYVQQPFKVTITVLTATWYTAPLDFDNIQIPNAFTLPFDQTTPGMFTINGNQYAGLRFYFIVFPYTAGSFTLPAINIIATTPPVGSSDSRKVHLKTPPRHFIVKPVPEKLKGENWLVAKNVFIKEHWNKSLHNLKVGDVIERTVTIDAKGTLPQFIPSLHHASLSFASEYLQDAELDDERNEYDANGRLTQSVIYLLEKEGDFVIPAVEIQWWNPLNSKLFKRTAASAKIHVQPNPNLGMMASIKDSLAATQTIKTTVTPHKGPLRIAGIAWYWFMVYLLAALALLYMIARFSLQVYTTLKARRMAYLQSDRYWFRQLQANSKLNAAFVDNMYRWWDRIRFPGKLPTISVTWKNNKEDVLNNEWAALTRSLYSAQQEPGDDITVFKKHLAQYQKTSKRISPLFTNELISETQLPWGNNKQTKNTSV